MLYGSPITATSSALSRSFFSQCGGAQSDCARLRERERVLKQNKTRVKKHGTLNIFTLRKQPPQLTVILPIFLQILSKTIGRKGAWRNYRRAKQESMVVSIVQHFLYIHSPVHCFFCRHSDSTVSEDAGIEPRTGYNQRDSDRSMGYVVNYFLYYGEACLCRDIIWLLVGFGRAMRPCAARTCLINMQNRSLYAPPFPSPPPTFAPPPRTHLYINASWWDYFYLYSEKRRKIPVWEKITQTYQA